MASICVLKLRLHVKKTGFLLFLAKVYYEDPTTARTCGHHVMAKTGTVIRSKEMGHIMQSGHGGRASLLSLF